MVDVPGHERFVKNMLAGACGVDAMLLVIAADEGVMPQTREHLDILDLLGVSRGVVALTKTDMVEADWLDLVTESVTEYLAERGFGSFPVVPVSSRTGAGRDALLEALAGQVATVEDRPASGGVRLPVDRAFTVEGFGTVVTGTLWRGAIAPRDRLVIQPGGVEARVRSVEVHGVEVESARAGQRTAVALPGVAKEDTPRGVWLVSRDTLATSHMLDVRVRTLTDVSKGLRHRQRVRFHLGASEILGRVFLLEGDLRSLPERRRPCIQMRLEEPAVAERGGPIRAALLFALPRHRRRDRFSCWWPPSGAGAAPRCWRSLRREESGYGGGPPGRCPGGEPPVPVSRPGAGEGSWAFPRSRPGVRPLTQVCSAEGRAVPIGDPYVSCPGKRILSASRTGPWRS